MQTNQKIEHKFGLLGKNISYSFSRNYFTKKFNELDLHNYEYVNFDIDGIEEFPQILKENPNLKGLNVTIPYKEAVIPFLDELDIDAEKIGAVNTIKILKNGKLKGYNTDAFGFENSLKPFLKKYHNKALILGTGGASKAIKFILDKLEIDSMFVSRNPKNENEISYDNLSETKLKKHKLVINCTPLGTFPAIEKHPNLSYKVLNSWHLLYDLIYNPAETTFLKKGKKQGAKAVNGLRMLELQAEEAWRIWENSL